MASKTWLTNMKKTLVLLVAILSVTALALAGFGQDTGSLKLSGYVRPGNLPADEVLAKIKEFRGKVIGATIYVGVYDRVADAGNGDSFGTGMAGFDDKFRRRQERGQARQGHRCIYLYQIVNDRGMADLEVPASSRRPKTFAASASSCRPMRTFVLGLFHHDRLQGRRQGQEIAAGRVRRRLRRRCQYQRQSQEQGL